MHQNFNDLAEFLRPLRIEYRDEIKRLAEEAIAECATHVTDLDDYLWETVDSHEWVIITFKARMVPLVCECDADEAAADFGIETTKPESIAFAAMLTDLREAVARLQEEAA